MLIRKTVKGRFFGLPSYILRTVWIHKIHANGTDVEGASYLAFSLRVSLKKISLRMLNM